MGNYQGQIPQCRILSRNSKHYHQQLASKYQTCIKCLFKKSGLVMQKNMTLTLLHHQLHRHLKSGCSYNQISTARSMLSTLIDSNELSWGNKPIVKRFMKGLFETNPIFQNYCSIWDVSLVLNYFRKLPPPQKLSLSLLSKRLALFLTLISGGQRCQTVHAIDVKDIIVSDTKLIIPIMEKNKTNKTIKTYVAP